MSPIYPRACGSPGPGDRHCTLRVPHKTACHDHFEGEHWSLLDAFVHDCDEPKCRNQHFDHPGMTHLKEWATGRPTNTRRW